MRFDKVKNIKTVKRYIPEKNHLYKNLFYIYSKKKISLKLTRIKNLSPLKKLIFLNVSCDFEMTSLKFRNKKKKKSKFILNMYSIQSAPWLISMGRFKKKSFSKRRLKLKAHKHFYYMNYAISSPVTQDFFYFSYAAFSEKFKPIALNNGAIIKLFINNFLSHLINYFYIFENVFDFSALSTIVFPTFYYSYFGGYKKLNFKIRG